MEEAGSITGWWRTAPNQPLAKHLQTLVSSELRTRDKDAVLRPAWSSPPTTSLSGVFSEKWGGTCYLLDLIKWSASSGCGGHQRAILTMVFTLFLLFIVSFLLRSCPPPSSAGPGFPPCDLPLPPPNPSLFHSAPPRPRGRAQPRGAPIQKPRSVSASPSPAPRRQPPITLCARSAEPPSRGGARPPAPRPSRAAAAPRAAVLGLGIFAAAPRSVRFGSRRRERRRRRCCSQGAV